MVIVSVLLGGMGASSVLAEVRVKAMLSTGQTLSGVLLRDDGQRLSLKDNKRTHTFASANVVECTIQITDEKIPSGVKGIQLGGYAKFLLTKKYAFLAEATLLCDLMRTFDRDKSGGLILPLWEMELALSEEPLKDPLPAGIKAMYSDARKKLPPRLGGAGSKTHRPRRYESPSPKAIASAIKTRDDWAVKMKRIAPKTHRIETAHFVIYSAWSKSNDAKLKSIFEKLYTALCKQFDMPQTEHIWIGKLPVFVFWERRNFVKFCVDVSDISRTMTEQISGYAGYRGWFQFVNLGPFVGTTTSKSAAQTQFYELLAHEATHAFMMRYIKYKWIASWLSEGIAEVLSTTLVPRGSGMRSLQMAHKIVKRGKGGQFLPMLTAENIPVEFEYYGAAQSLARFLLSKGKPKFIQLVSELKNDVGSEEALKKVYGLSHKTLLQQWARQIR
jgi:hypothetical protein